MELYTYQDFTKHKSGLTFAAADQIYSELVGLVEIAGREVASDWKSFLDACVTYAARRGRWLLLSAKQKGAIDDQRTSEHDNVILTLTIVRRQLARLDLPTDWFDKLALDPVQERKRLGDFACYVAYVYGVNAR